jgi:hypothetical protein
MRNSDSRPEEAMMTYYPFALFLHVSGAIGAFVSIGVWLVGLAALRRAQRVEQVRAIAWLIIVVSPIMVFSVLLIIGAGLAMALSVWGLTTSWIAVALGTLVLMAPVGPLILDTRMRTILAQAGAEPVGPISTTLAAKTHNPVMGSAAQALACLLLGIVFLMTTKPALGSSILVMVVALLLGLLSSFSLWRAPRLHEAQISNEPDNATVDPYLRTTFWTRRW